MRERDIVAGELPPAEICHHIVRAFRRLRAKTILFEDCHHARAARGIAALQFRVKSFRQLQRDCRRVLQRRGRADRREIANGAQCRRKRFGRARIS